MSHNRLVPFAGSRIRIGVEDKRSSDLADFLFRDAYSADPGEPHSTLSLSHRDSNGLYYFFVDGQPSYVGPSEGNLLRDVMDKAIHALATEASGGLLFHAAALRWRGKAVLLPGASGSGKSTLAAWLAHSGFGYMTDELAFVPLGGAMVDALARPLNIKTRGLDAVRAFLDLDEHEAELVRGGAATLIPHRLLNPEFENHRQSPLGAIVFPSYAAGAGLQLRRLSAGEASLHLMEVLVNARNIEGHGLIETVNLARQVPAWSMAYSEFSDIAERIRSMLEDDVSVARRDVPGPTRSVAR